MAKDKDVKTEKPKEETPPEVDEEKEVEVKVDKVEQAERGRLEDLESRCHGGANYPSPKEMLVLRRLRKKYRPDQYK